MKGWIDASSNEMTRIFLPQPSEMIYNPLLILVKEKLLGKFKASEFQKKTGARTKPDMLSYLRG